MKKHLTIDDFTPRKIKKIPMPVILWSELEMKMGKRRLRNFEKWMKGQTSTISGVYQGDLERYLEGKEPLKF